MRVLSYNVRSLRDDPQAVARVIRSCEPDVVCIQEAPRFLRWRSKCAALARESGLLVVTGGRTAGGVLLLASLRTRVLGTRDLRLPRQQGLHQRGLAIGVLELDGGTWTVASMHLGLDPVERRRHVAEIFAVVADHPTPLVLAGDVNEEAGEPAWAALSARLQDAYAVAGTGPGETSSARRPTRRIDAVFADPGVEVVSCSVPVIGGRELATDHLPVLAELRQR
ncbi:MAG TPA: endonuclease/exonuclease/phosphatase family protein [Mycobacteriales bacterium]|nr:endonuclease/exonuclease/phosphatase family protein [Mycobacteriales bacterium]